MKKIKLGLFFGGKSTEHEVSIRSAECIVKNLNAERYELLPVGVDKVGKFHVGIEKVRVAMPEACKIIENACERANSGRLEFCKDIPDHLSDDFSEFVDVVFPIIHGYFGEDGGIQGLMRAFGIPFVGPDILGSAVGMDKDLQKRVFRERGIAVAKSITIFSENEANYKEVAKDLGEILFVKPANIGSSVGISKIGNEQEFDAAVRLAFLYDYKVVIEEFIDGREVECAVLGNAEPQVSLCGEIILKGSDFYDYDTKYIKSDGCKIYVPAEISEDLANKIRGIAAYAFKAACCEGMARVDFLIRKNGEPILNEINTVPGFTSISVYPSAWVAGGMSIESLVDNLVNLAFERKSRENKLKYSYDG